MTNTNNTFDLFDHYVVPSYTRNRVVFVKGKGAKLWDSTGKVYLDFLAGISVANTGHCHPLVSEAIAGQAARLIHVSNLYYNENQGRLAKALSDLALHGKCFFCNSGAEANEALIKLARLWGSSRGRYEVITMQNSFHGRTIATLTATGQTKVQDGFAPLPEGFKHAEFNNLESVRAAISEQTAAVLVEAVQGEGGVIPATREFMQGLREMCSEKGILLLCDEVQCGMGRTGNWFGFQAYGIEPDACSMAKALGSGYPIGAILTNRDLADVFQPGHHASTFGGSPLACAAALATIQVIQDERLLQNAVAMGKRLKDGLQALVDKYAHLTDVRGTGLMLGLVLDQTAKDLEQRLMDMGLITLATAGNVIRMLPPLNVRESEIDEALDMIDDVCEEWHIELDGISVDETDVNDEPAAAPAEPAAPATPGAE
ncbi:MAG: aspartate aminotransferase family protein [Lentisphaerae bacterium]|nr:aspartate aminotransferase family protein [Lentisphaerota bacterium]